MTEQFLYVMQEKCCKWLFINTVHTHKARRNKQN
uniref:Uncharacterized protein n=1 Tax=Anguilla anguilla TaxID=7936 RepID=A0A0E9WV57_ANGAN